MNMLTGVHTPDDGKGRRIVKVNGIEIEHAIYADTEKGVVIAHKIPLEVDNDELKTVEFSGRVEVYLWGDA